MADLLEVLAAREQRAMERAEEAAGRLRSASSPVESIQLDLEASLGDLVHYRGLSTQLADYARAGGPYAPGSGASFLSDLADRSSAGAQERLSASRRAGVSLAALERRAITTGSVTGLVPPQYLVDDAAPVARAGAPLVSLIGKALPEYGMSTVISTWTTPTAPETQASENASLTNTTVAQGTATLLVRTFDDRVDVSLQVLHRAGPGVDAQLIPDIIAALAQKIDNSVINGDGTGGAVTGFLSTASTTATAYTDASPTLAEAWPRVEVAYRASTTARGRASVPMIAVMHSRRWSWIRERRAVESGLDLTLEESVYPEAVARAGDLHFVVDDNIPTNLGAGTNEDRIIVAPADVLALYVSPPTVSVNIQTSGLGNMTATITGYQYAAFNAGRGLPAAVAIVGGTGLIGP